MSYYRDPHRPRVAIPPAPTNTSPHYTGNPSDQRLEHIPYAFEETPPPYDNSDLPTLDSPWPYQPATPDTSIARVRSMMDLSGRSQSFSTHTNNHLAFPEPQLFRSVSHGQTQHASTSSHRTSNTTNDTSSTSLNLQRQISTSSFHSTASSYWQDHDAESSISEARFRMQDIQIFVFSLGLPL